MLKLPIITDPDWLPNAHAGSMLVSEFMQPLDMSAETLASALDIVPARLEVVINGEQPVDADLDLRLTRYFRMSEGFFLRLQTRYELLEAKRALNGELDRIIPHAA